MITRSAMLRILCLSLVVCLGLVSGAQAEQIVKVCFRTDESLAVVERPVPDGKSELEAALEALVAGPSAEEADQGIVSAIPAGTTINSIQVFGDQVEIDLSRKLLAGGIDDEKVEAIFEQFRWTLEPLGMAASVKLTVDGIALPLLLKPGQTVEPRPKEITKDVLPQLTADGTALSGRDISLSPGHGYRWGGSSWVYDRPVYCAPLSREDHHNVDMLCIYLDMFLAQDGANVLKYRCLDKDYGTDPYTGSPWWYMSGSYWLEHLGYPCTVYANYSGDCTLGSGASESSDCIRSRPVASNYDDTDLHIAMHTNGYQGDCFGMECPNGTATYYDGSDSTWGPPSLSFGQDVQAAIVDVIQNKYADGAWRNRGVLNDSGGFAETRIPDRPSILLELAFHDSCDWDALYLQDPFFQCATMWGVYKGCCDYLGVTPTFDFYSDEYVSDTIPTMMNAEESYGVSITLRNRGVLWTEDKQIRLGAVGDSDPFAATRHTITGTVNPNSTYTFNFTMTAPTTPGFYTTDWRMLREGFTCFGATVEKQVEVVGEGTPIPPTDTPTVTPTDTPSPNIPDDIILDNAEPGFSILSGSWATGTMSVDKYGADYRYNTTGTGLDQAQFQANFTHTGSYNVYCWYPQGSNRPIDAEHVIYHAGGTEVVDVNQTTNGGMWNLLGTVTLNSGLNKVVITDNSGEASKVVMADAIKWVWAGAVETNTPTNTPSNTPTNTPSNTPSDTPTTGQPTDTPTDTPSSPPTDTPTDTPTLGAEVVTITYTYFKGGKDELTVRANSTHEPGVTLTVVGYGDMTWTGSEYEYLEKKVSDPGGSVTVTSTGGGSDTESVPYP